MLIVIYMDRYIPDVKWLRSWFEFGLPLLLLCDFFDVFAVEISLLGYCRPPSVLWLRVVM